jgi:hypothetical protein
MPPEEPAHCTNRNLVDKIEQPHRCGRLSPGQIPLVGAIYVVGCHPAVIAPQRIARSRCRRERRLAPGSRCAHFPDFAPVSPEAACRRPSLREWGVVTRGNAVTASRRRVHGRKGYVLVRSQPSLLGIFGHKAFTKRTGRKNQSFNHAGNGCADAAAAACAYVWGPKGVFHLLASMAIASIICVLVSRRAPLTIILLAASTRPHQTTAKRQEPIILPVRADQNFQHAIGQNRSPASPRRLHSHAVTQPVGPLAGPDLRPLSPCLYAPVVRVPISTLVRCTVKVKSPAYSS